MNVYTQDNRDVTPTSIFIALKGLERDGHIFIEDTLTRGAKKIVFHDESYKQKIPKARQVFVLDTEEWLIAKAKAKIKKAKVITICGSVGKTTTTKLTHHLITNLTKVSVFTPRFGINTLRGICLEILNKYKGEKIVLLETAMDEYLELDKIANVFAPHICAIVNIDISHFEKLKSMSRILRTEFGMCTSNRLTHAIVNYNNKYIQKFVDKSYKKLFVKRHKLVKAENLTKQLSLKIIPKHFSVNLNVSLEILKLFKKKLKGTDIQHVINTFTPADKRFEIYKVKSWIILNDCYNAAPLSFKVFFNYSKNMKGKKLGIVGQINEIGILSQKYHQNVFDTAIKTFDYCVFVGSNFDFLKSNLPNAAFAQDYKEAITILSTLELNNYTIIGIKGSRGVALENVTNVILQRNGIDNGSK